MTKIQPTQTKREKLVASWIDLHKIIPCPICGKTFSKQGRGMAWLSAKRHVMACKGK